MIAGCRVYSDCLDINLPGRIEAGLVGRRWGDTEGLDEWLRDWLVLEMS